jgi:tRNA modification GTPase
VVSCGDLDRGAGLEFPASVKTLITDETFVLFNKSDLVSGDLETRFRGPHRWMTSLKTGDGTTEFLEGFAKALQAKYE